MVKSVRIFGENDNIQGVSSNIMLGQEIKSGTGSVDLLFDEKMYMKNESNLNNNYETNLLEIPTNIENNCNIENIQNNIDLYIQVEEIDTSLFVDINIKIIH